MDLLKQGVQDYLIKDSHADRTPRGRDAWPGAIRYAMHRQQAGAEIQRLYRHGQRQRELLHQKNQRLGKLYAVAQKVVENVSHEFRTPLTVIKEYVSLIQEGLLGAVNPEQARYLDVIGDRAEDLNRMVEDMLDISKLDAGMLTVRRTECSVHEALRPFFPADAQGRDQRSRAASRCRRSLAERLLRRRQIRPHGQQPGGQRHQVLPGPGTRADSRLAS